MLTFVGECEFVLWLMRRILFFFDAKVALTALYFAVAGEEVFLYAGNS